MGSEGGHPASLKRLSQFQVNANGKISTWAQESAGSPRGALQTAWRTRLPDGARPRQRFPEEAGAREPESAIDQHGRLPGCHP